MKSLLFISFIMMVNFLAEFTEIPWYDRKKYHRIKALSDDDMVTLANLSDIPLFEKTLDEILIPRVPQTPGSKKVRQFIVESMQYLDWKVELDTFKDATPIGILRFTNVIATLDPKAPRRLLLCCHYDSLYKGNELVTATDSAVPCAMMIDIAQTLDTYLKKTRKVANDITLQLIFFDGEEALDKWTDTDSLYGSRHLAAQWQKIPYPYGNNVGTTELDRIDLFVLLDLLGEEQPIFYNYILKTKDYYKSIINIEHRLRTLELLKNHPANYFLLNFLGVVIGDDHTPFFTRGVPALHIIPACFPKGWHKESDNKHNLDFETIDNLNKIFRIFVFKYLHLEMD